jgi:hypothetical protein
LLHQETVVSLHDLPDQLSWNCGHFELLHLILADLDDGGKEKRTRLVPELSYDLCRCVNIYTFSAKP